MLNDIDNLCIFLLTNVPHICALIKYTVTINHSDLPAFIKCNWGKGIRKMAKVQRKFLVRNLLIYKFVNMQDPIENQRLKSTVEGQLSAADSNTIIELNSKKNQF